MSNIPCQFDPTSPLNGRHVCQTPSILFIRLNQQVEPDVTSLRDDHNFLRPFSICFAKVGLPPSAHARHGNRGLFFLANSHIVALGCNEIFHPSYSRLLTVVKNNPLSQCWGKLPFRTRHFFFFLLVFSFSSLCVTPLYPRGATH